MKRTLSKNPAAVIADGDVHGRHGMTRKQKNPFRVLPCLPWTFALLAFAALHGSASACAVCMGDPNSALAVASDAALWTLLALVGFIFFSTGATAFYLWRRSKRPIPAHIQFVENLNSEPEEC